MNIEDYQTTNHLINGKTSDLYEEEDERDKALILRTIRNITNYYYKNHNFILFLQFIYLNTYFFSQTLQLSPFIKNYNHRKITNYTYAYDLTIVMMLSYSVNCLSEFYRNFNRKRLNDFNFVFKNSITKLDLFIYAFLNWISAFIFAILGEIPFLQTFTISGDFYKHLTVKELAVFAVIGLPIIFYTLRDIYRLIRLRECSRTLFLYFPILILFGFNYLTLFLYKAKNIHYHIHHAIFAGLMAIINNNWSDRSTFVFHAVYMGVLVEGISFYGLEELYIFMVDDPNNIIQSATFSGILTLSSITSWFIYFIFFYK